MARDLLSMGSRVIPASKLTLGPLLVGATRQSILAKLDCTQHLNPGVLLTLSFEISYDNESTWEFVTSTTRPGGVVFGEDGTPDNEIYFNMILRPERGTRRRVRCHLELTGGSFVTSGGSIEVAD